MTNLNRGKSFGFCVAIAFSYYILGFAVALLIAATSKARKSSLWECLRL